MCAPNLTGPNSLYWEQSTFAPVGPGAGSRARGLTPADGCASTARGLTSLTWGVGVPGQMKPSSRIRVAAAPVMLSGLAALSFAVAALLLASGCLKSTGERGSDGGAGATCARGSECVSNLCKGHCCGQECGTDPTCGATACDSAGACVYPTGNCAASTCDEATGQIAASTCQSGSCVPGSPQPCPDHFGCADPSTCATACSQPTDCAPRSYCNDGGCAPLGAPGEPCPLDAGCLSGFCGAGDGATARCCAAACVS